MSPAALPTGRQGRLLALLLLLVALGGIYLFAVAPLLDVYAERTAVMENRRMLVPRLNAAADELPGLLARVAELRVTASTHKVTLRVPATRSLRPICKAESRNWPRRSAR
jgi:hypothetical protein